MFLTLGVAAVTGFGVVGVLPASGADRHVVVATTSIWADIVNHIDCTDEFEVQTLIPVGGDAHSYEPAMQDREQMSEAALIVANGGDLEEQLHDTLRTVEEEGTALLEVFEHVTTAPMGNDPHIWFDPTIVIEAAPVIGDALIEAGADEAGVDECVALFSATLEALDAELSETLSVVPPERRLLVTNHDALGYFARRYDFEILGSVLPGSSTLSESSPAELQELSDAFEEAGVPAIFTEQLESADEATALADRLGVDIVTLYTDSLGDEGSGAETYADLMRFDANAIAGALGE